MLTTATPVVMTASRTFSILVLVPLRLFLAAGWLRAGVEKLVSGAWWRGDGLRGFLTAHSDSMLSFVHPVCDRFIDPLAMPIAIVVMVTEVACGIAIAIGRPLRAALRWGLVLNVVFIACGQVNPSAFYIVMEMTLLLAIAEGVIGGDRSLPTWRTLGLAAVCGLAGLALVPYIRTVTPAGVITDPAVMLSFLAVIAALTLVLRFSLSARVLVPSRLSRWTQRVVSWALARPTPTSAQQADASAQPVSRRTIESALIELSSPQSQRHA